MTVSILPLDLESSLEKVVCLCHPRNQAATKRQRAGTVTDTVPGGVFPRHLLNEEDGIRPHFLMAVDDIPEIRPEDVVAEHQHELVVNVVFGSQQRMRKPALFALMSVSDVCLGHRNEILMKVRGDPIHRLGLLFGRNPGPAV